jgi:hypothetical protein
MTPSQQAAEGVKAIPAITVSSMTFAGYGVQDWLVVVTLIYTLLQVYLLIRRMVVSRRTGDPECARTCSLVRREES